MENKAPVYVRIPEYEEAMQTLQAVKRKQQEARELLDKLVELRTQEEKEVSAWAASLDEVETRLETLQKNLVQ